MSDAETQFAPNGARLAGRARESLAMGAVSTLRRGATAEPICIERGFGPYLYDADGHTFIDYGLAWGPLILGSCHPELVAAVNRQLGEGFSFGPAHTGEIELAERLVSILPGVERVVLSNTGTEGVQAAIRLARATTARRRVVKFEGHYHGWLDEMLVSTHPTTAQLGSPTPDAGQDPRAFKDIIVLPWNDLTAIETAFAEDPEDIACVIMEPVLANSGSCMPDEGYLQDVVDLCRRRGAVSIFDEVITGFRLALGGAREYFRVEPDLTVYGKALGGGFPISAVGGRKELFDVLEDGRTIHAGTFNGNCLATAAALQTLTVLARPGVFDRMHEHGYALRETFEEEGGKCGQEVVTSGVGSVFHVHFRLSAPPRSHRDVLLADTARYEFFRTEMLHEEVHLLPHGRWYVGAAHTDLELTAARSRIRRCMARVGARFGESMPLP